MTEFSISIKNATVAEMFHMVDEIGRAGQEIAGLATYLPFIDRFTDPPVVVADLDAEQAPKVLRFIMDELIPLIQKFDASAEKN